MQSRMLLIKKDYDTIVAIIKSHANKADYLNAKLTSGETILSWAVNQRAHTIVLLPG